MFASNNSDGFNGHFLFRINGLPVNVIASDGSGSDDPAFAWQHVSVSIATGNQNPPSWSVMCQIKDLFWGDDEWVIQFHPPASEYINNHPGVLHLWRPLKASIPTPPPETVGIKGIGPGQWSEAKMLEEYIKANSEKKKP